MALQQSSKQETTYTLPAWQEQQTRGLQTGAFNQVIDPATGMPRQMNQYDKPLSAGINPYFQQSVDTAANMSRPDYQTVNAQMGNAAAGSESQYVDPRSIGIGQAYDYSQYDPAQFNFGDVKFNDTLAGYNPNLQNYDVNAAQFQGADFNARDYNFMQNMERVNAQQINAPDRSSIRDVNAPGGLQSFLIGGANQVVAPELQQYLMQQPGMISADKLGPVSQWTDQGVQQSYMNPYQQAVTDIAQRKAKETYQEQLAAEGSRAAAAGAFGGSRQGIIESGLNRDYALQAGDIQAQGLNAAYQNAQQQFMADRASKMQGGQFDIGTQADIAKANQQAQMQAGLANQQSLLGTQNLGASLGMQASLANQSAARDIALANQQAQLGTQQLGTQTGMQGQLANQQADIGYMGQMTDIQRANQQAALQAALANQSQGMQGQIAGAQLGSQERQFGANLSQEAAMQNAQLQQQANLANQQGKLSTQALGANLGMDALKTRYQGGLQAGLANQQAGIQGLQMGEQSRQYGFGQQQQAGQFQANLGLQGQIAQQQARQAATNSNLQGFGQSADIWRGIGQNDTQAFQNQLNQNQQLGTLGMAQQGYDQAANDRDYQMWQLQQAYPMASMQQLAGILNSGPQLGTTTTTGYTQKPSMWGQIGGALMSGAGILSGVMTGGASTGIGAGLGSIFGGGKGPGSGAPGKGSFDW